jgi:deazaflavin-dependent oxidoreductase (nitroreductase family)
VYAIATSKRFYRRLRFLNSRLFPRLYRWLGGRFYGDRYLLLTTIGRRTGKPHTTPVIYLTDDEGTIYLFSVVGRKADWFQNILKNERVSVTLGKKSIDAVAEVVSDVSRLQQVKRLYRRWQAPLLVSPFYARVLPRLIQSLGEETPVVAVTLKAVCRG